MLTAIGIGLCTNNRPVLLQRALSSLAQLRTPKGTQLRLLVVDGDPQGSAQAVCAKQESMFGYPIQCVPVLGHRVMRRNAILSFFLREKSPYLACCDDDAQVDVDWLEVLYHTLIQEKVDIVTDYVNIRCDGQQHLHTSMVIRPLRRATRVAFARSGNVLIRTAIVGQERFDSRFQAYGEDTHFFLRLHEKGARILAIPAYKITETWPMARARFSFLWMRHYEIGRTSSFIFRDVLGGKGWRQSLVTAWKKMLYAPFHPFLFWCMHKKGVGLLPVRQSAWLCARALGHLVGLFHTRP